MFKMENNHDMRNFRIYPFKHSRERTIKKLNLFWEKIRCFATVVLNDYECV